MIDVKCPGCGQASQAPDKAAGKGIRCPRCQKLITVPSPSVADIDTEDFFQRIISVPSPPVADIDKDYFQRLIMLEQANRSLLRRCAILQWGGLAALALISLALAGLYRRPDPSSDPSGVPESIRAQSAEFGVVVAKEFAVSDGKGNIRVSLGLGEFDQPRLVLEGTHGGRATLAVAGKPEHEDYEVLKLGQGEFGKSILISNPPGGPSISLYDKNDDQVFTVTNSEFGSTFLSFGQPKSRAFAQMGMMSDGTSHLELANPSGEVVNGLNNKSSGFSD